ncbi:hypothetical protein MBLNU230_g5462t1 [Neophaeotheca triangularis]
MAQPTPHAHDEKHDHSAVEGIEDLKQNPDHADDGIDENNQPKYDDAETKRILRKVDFRLIPMLTLLYVLAFLDRSNIGNAKIAGMNEELGLSGSQYNIALTVFFFPYALLEVPSNIVLKLMKPSLWITIMMVSWGVVMTLQGIVQDYHGLVATRVMLGVTEAGFFPAATYLLTEWYCRFEIQTRLAVFFSAASMAGAFSGLLAFALEKMDGIGGLSGWRWIYIIDEVSRLSWSAPWSMSWFPTRLQLAASLLNGKKILSRGGSPMIRVLLLEKCRVARNITLVVILKAALSEWRIYLAVIVYWGNSICLYGFTYSAPTIVQDLGYTSANAQLLTIPIYFLGVCSTIFFSWLADRYQTRWPFIIIPYSVAALAFTALLAIPQPRIPGLTYAFLFAIPAGVYPPLIGILSWVGNNLAPSWKRAVGMALLISIGNLGGAIGSNIFLAEQAPQYWLGYGLALGMLVAAICATLVLRWSYGHTNKKRDRLDEHQIRAEFSEEQLLAMGDKSPLYRYVV